MALVKAAVDEYCVARLDARPARCHSITAAIVVIDAHQGVKRRLDFSSLITFGVNMKDSAARIWPGFRTRSHRYCFGKSSFTFSLNTVRIGQHKSRLVRDVG